jgi:hypothetical protein
MRLDVHRLKNCSGRRREDGSVAAREEAPEDAPTLEIMLKRGLSVMSSMARRRKEGTVVEGRRKGTEMNKR